MVSTSKVLTVSYGTFSCTLEGFDDSFDTMKAIAEYFRDLAADDRYFGAEPPTPDAEMLARIAEKEIARRVEARFEGDNIVLRTALPGAAAMAETHAEARGDLPPVVAEPDVVAEDSAEAIPQDADDADDADADALFPAIDLSAIQTAADDSTLDDAPEVENETAQSDSVDAILDTDAVEEPEDDGSIAAKLARIRAVVGKPQEAAPLYSEDEHADEILDTLPGDTDLADIIAVPVEDAEDLAEDDEQDETIASVLGSLSGAGDEPSAEDEAAQQQDAVADFEQLPDQGVEEDGASDTLTDTDIEETAEQAPEVEDAAVDPAPVAPRRPVRARVIKMKRAEFEQAVAEGDLEEVTEDSDVTEDTASDETSLTVEDEDDLQRELAAVEAELAGVDGSSITPQPDPDLHLEPVPHAHDASGRDDLVQPPEAEMDRLISQAHNELEEPEGKQRRNALGHLRAAVAAARADKDAGTSVEKSDDTEAYRSDLDQAVRPARPVRRVSGQTAERVSPAPLKLVAEQRVDMPQDTSDATPARPVRPRRVAKAEPVTQGVADAPAEDVLQDENAQDVTEISADGTFMDFAEVMGATELPDLLEAAAAYLAFVEGRDQFSRPQLMTKVRMVQEENFSREDGLRSFGQLLRQGKIEKIAGGRFTVSDRISFKPDTRAAG